jgi:ABC-type antimicrobial peptide transport system permease subunit
LLLFSYFFAKNIREKVAIMKVLGAKNSDVFKEVFAKFIRISSIGIAAGLALSKITIDFMMKSFTSQYSAVNISNIILSSMLIFIISIIVSILVLFNVIRFKIMKEIR